ncbi:hypothetical protein [Microlunatus soli]|uniref:Uncharacterized protein n=1 Tax=Microlunatus soli TaxID=630515 RepID=A0A1H1S1N4_9ACTN|nr:hypothetical protein [Microlunatus soli]SDS41940.1 hypothetical protein SAMN04489812_1851 [Microlunatus soli]
MDPGPAGGQAVAADPTRRRRNLIIAAVAVLLVIALVLTLITVLNQRRSAATDDAVTGAVRGYLSAIADGDSQRALGYLADRPDNTDLLTDQALAASEKIAPITAISVPDIEDGARTVQAWYKIGDQRYHQEFTVRPGGDAFLIEDGTAVVDLADLPEGLTYRLNGEPVKSGSAEVFPGSYRITSTSTYLSLGSHTTFAAAARDRVALTVNPELNDDGTAAVRKALSTAVQDCLATTTLKAGCGLTISAAGPNGSTVKEDSVQRSLPAESKERLGEIGVFLDPKDPTLVRTEGIPGSVQTSASCESEKKGKKSKKSKKKAKTKTEDCTITGSGTSLATPTARLADDKITIGWR